ncbi:MAG: AMP-binding protein, partial [Planctomycetota bacterium]|nr:AMP-binding protein [Planctomycetota bacterium]
MKIICFGDSLTACGGDEGRFSDILADRFPGHLFVNKGVGGESFVEARARFEQDVLAEKPDVVLLELGAVDWWRNERPPEAWAADLEDFVRRSKQNGAKVVILGVFGDYLDASGQRRPKTYGSDERAIAYRGLEAEIARRYGCPYIANIQERIIGDRCCWLDANHPNERGNRYVADAIEPVLADILGCRPLPLRKPNLRTLRDFWQEAVQLAPQRLAVVDGDRRLTYGEADNAVQRLAAGLAAEAGAEKPRVAVFLPNCLEYYLLYWAVQYLGGVIIPLNTWLKEEGLRGIFQRVQPQILIVQSERDIAPLHAAAAAPPRRILALEPGSSAIRPYRRLYEHGAEPPLPEIAADDLAIIMHTSGTTAVPKGAMMRHSDLMFNVATAINAHQFSSRDVHLLVNPMFHATALYSMLPTAAYQKSAVVIVATTSPD